MESILKRVKCFCKVDFYIWRHRGEPYVAVCGSCSTIINKYIGMRERRKG